MKGLVFKDLLLMKKMNKKVILVMYFFVIAISFFGENEVICPLSSRQVKYLKVSDKNTYISFWSVGIFMHTISLYIF